MDLSFHPGIQDCPGCFARVIILSDGICPRCRHDARNSSQRDPNQVAIWIHCQDTLPERCYHCSLSATNRIQVEHSEAHECTEENSRSRRLAATLAGLLFGWLWYFIVRDRGRSANARQIQTLTIRVPACNACRRLKIRPAGASIPDQSMKLAVHRQFSDEWKALNSGA